MALADLADYFTRGLRFQWSTERSPFGRAGFLAQFFQARLRIAVVEIPLGDLAVRFLGRFAVPLLLQRPAVEIGHLDRALVTLIHIVGDDDAQRVDGLRQLLLLQS